MGLPERKHYDVKGAAEWLGCSESDVDYYLREGQLRYAVARENYDGFAMILFNDLPELQQGQINRLPRDAYLREVLDIIYFPIELLEKPLPDYLYVKYATVAGAFAPSDEPGDVWSCRLENLAGERVTLWYREFDSLGGVYIRRQRGEDDLDELMVSLEELKLFSGKGEASTKEDRLPEERLPFVPPEKADEIALAMCEYGNRYVKDHGKVPTAAQLRNFMMNTGAKDLGLSYGAGGRDFNFNEKRLTKRRFADRLKDYTK